MRLDGNKELSFLQALFTLSFLVMKYLFIFLIRIYQLCLSPFLGQCCRFAPSCSAYAQEAIETHGVLKGTWLMCKRLVKCGPWHPGGYDPIPNKKSSDSSPAE